jgi:redox-sensing transcriptional repressor
MKEKSASKNQLRRYPVYLSYLREKQAEGLKYISSPQIASSLDLSEEQVRKDLNLASSRSGKPKVGRDIKLLIFDIEEFLGYRDSRRAVLVGAGHLGRALMAHDGFVSYGLDIVCAFDNDINKTDCIFNDKHIYSIGELETKCKELNVHIGIITVPQKYAQEVCNRLVAVGIKGIWNFTSAVLEVNDDVIVQNENMASSLAILSNKLKDRLY